MNPETSNKIFTALYFQIAFRFETPYFRTSCFVIYKTKCVFNKIESVLKTYYFHYFV